MKKVEINGKDYTLSYTIGAMKIFKERTGLNPFNGDIFNEVDPYIFSELLFCMTNEKITMEDIDSISVNQMTKLEGVLETVMNDSDNEKK